MLYVDTHIPMPWFFHTVSILRFAVLAKFPSSCIKTMSKGWGIVAYPVIQAIGRPDFEDVLRTRSPGEVVSDRLSVRTSSMVTLVSILG